METGQKERAGKEPEKQTPEAKLQQKKGRLRRWLRANRLPLLAFAFVTTAAGALTYQSATTDSPALVGYVEGKGDFQMLSLKDKIRVWRWRINAGGCDRNVVSEATEERMRQEDAGMKMNSEMLKEEIEAFIQVLATRAREGRCNKTNGQD